MSFSAEPPGRPFDPSREEDSRTTPVMLGGPPASAEAGEEGPPDVEGRVLAERFRVRRLLRKGGMGSVFEAEDLQLGSPTALKFLSPRLARQPRRRRRFKGEVTLARRVSHPNVCRVHDVSETKEGIFLSMELIRGEDLSSCLARVGQLPYLRALEVGIAVCDGLEAAHGCGVLHRDLKPSNVMISLDGEVKITDFGLASLSESGKTRDVRSGTPTYMSPEQLAGRGVSQKSDLYALGLLLYRLFAGVAAFPGKDSRSERLERQRNGPPAPPSRHVPDLPPALDRLILRCLAFDPEHRPASAAAVGAVLRDVSLNREGAVLKTFLVSRWEPPGEASEEAREAGGAEGEGAEERAKRLAESLAEEHGGRALAGPGSSVELLFERPIQAVRYALAYHRGLAEGSLGAAAVSLHLGETLLTAGPEEDGEVEAAGRARELTEAVAGLARPGQTLLTRAAFDLAREHRINGAGQVRWLAHGAYEIDGIELPLEVFEVGEEGRAPLAPPAEGPGVRLQWRQEQVSGWRPAPGLYPPQRPEWMLERKLSEGGFGEVWLASHQGPRPEGKEERRVFKFCFDAERLRGLKREITLFRLLKETLGERDDISRIFDWNFDEAPYFIESAYTEGGSLVDWAERRGGLSAVPLAERLEIIAQVATALAAAHSVGVLHKDVKPANVLITQKASGGVQARLSDFGVGRVIERRHLEKAGITAVGFTGTAGAATREAAFSGTRLYMAPELLEGKPATVQADIYALGVTLYQVVVGDLSRALAPGWEREVEDPLLVSDIADAVDGSPERRPADARQLAERLRGLPERRWRRAEKERERREALAAHRSLLRARKRRKLAAAVIVVLVLFAGVFFVQSRKSAESAAMSAVVLEFLEGIFKVQDPYRSPESPENYEAFIDREARRVETEFARQPKIQAHLSHTLGVVYRTLGAFEKAEAWLGRALALRTELWGDDDPRVAETLTAQADVLNQRGKADEGRARAERAFEIYRKTEGPRALPTADSLEILGHSHYLEGEYDAAEERYRECLSIRREHLGEDHRLVARVLFPLGNIARLQGRDEEAETLLRDSLARHRRLLGNDHPDIAQHLFGLATVLRNLGDLEQAERHSLEALEINRAFLGEGHPHVSSNRNQLALLLHLQGRHDEAESLARESLAAYRAGVSEGRLNLHAAQNELLLARMLLSQGRLEPAEEMVDSAVAEMSRALAPDHWSFSYAQAIRAACLHRRGDLREARSLLLPSYQHLLDELGERQEPTQMARGYLDAVEEDLGSTARASW